MTLLTHKEVQDYLSIVDKVPAAERMKITALLEMDRVERCKESFLPFVKEMWPIFISGKHHQIMADAFERVARGELKRLIINMPPRHTKSEFASFLLPSWFLGKFPEKKVIQTAHTAELSTGFGRKVRNLVSSDVYQKVFQTKLSTDSKAAGRWNTDKGGDYFAIGVGGAVTGKGADLLIIDDPHSEQEAKQNNPAVFDQVYEWYTSGPRQRLQPNGAIIIVMCMTGDTNVLMADGTSTQLKNIRPEDVVATFDKGRLSSRKINNWKSSGVDAIYKIQTQSGIILRANKRHPFLVMNEGVLEWTRLNQLRAGDLLVSLKGVTDLQGQKQSPENVGHAKPTTATTEKTLTPHVSPLEVMGCGLESYASVVNQSNAKDSVQPATGSNTHLQKEPQSSEGLHASNTDTALPLKPTQKWLKSVGIDVMYAVKSLLQKTQERIGAQSYASTTATTQASSEACSVTTATLPLVTERQQAYLNELHRISDFTVDPIVSITSDGQEEVFDVEVDETENFIANGIVSHNTRWAKRDLTGQILKKSGGDGVDDWEVIEFPAILPSGTPLWPAFWSKKELEAIKAEIPVAKWEAQYQQNPTGNEGAIIKRDQWKIWENERLPPCDYIIQSWDTAFEKNNRADYSACTTWGVFDYPDTNGKDQTNIILLDAFKRRMEFPELKKLALELYKQWEPDTLIIEKRAAGAPLIYELRKIGVPLSEYTPSKGNDKISRVNSIADLFASGIVWCTGSRDADEVMEEMAAFPNGDNDDLVDSSSQALMRFRQGGFIQIASDEQDDEPIFRRKYEYY